MIPLQNQQKYKFFSSDRRKSFSENLACAGHGNKSMQMIFVNILSQRKRLFACKRRKNNVTLLMRVGTGDTTKTEIIWKLKEVYADCHNKGAQRNNKKTFSLLQDTLPLA